jgi:hypothetical protein
MSDLFIRILWKKAAGCQKFKPRPGRAVLVFYTGALFSNECTILCGLRAFVAMMQEIRSIP